MLSNSAKIAWLLRRGAEIQTGQQGGNAHILSLRLPLIP